MSTSLLARSLLEPPTLKLNEKARLLREKGEPVIHLGSGEPKSKVPIEAIRSAAAKLVSAEIRYTPTDGVPQLKKAIVRYMEDNYDKIVPPENIIASSGAKQSLSVLLATILNPQDEVIINAPYWVSYPDLVKMLYGIPVIVTPEDGSCHPRFQDIKAAVTSYTKAIIINSPNNPSGVIYSEELIAELVEFCEKKGIYLIMDDIYHKLIFSKDKEPVSVYKYVKKDIDDSKIAVVNGVSKLYGMTGFRIGWTVASKKVIEGMIKVQAQTASCPPIVSQIAAAGAINGIQSSVESLRLSLKNNAKVMVQELNSFEGVKVTQPDGTFYCLADFSNYGKDSEKLSNFILDKVMVVTVPGVAFGMEGHLRLSYCGSIKEITEGIARMKWALDLNSPNEIFIADRKLVRDWS